MTTLQPFLLARYGHGLDILQLLALLAGILLLAVVGAIGTPKPKTRSEEKDWLWVCAMRGCLRIVVAGYFVLCAYKLWEWIVE